MEIITKQKTPTPRQKKGAKAVIENLMRDKPIGVGEVLKSVGYGTGLQNQPKRVLESEGFKVALAEYGLTEELITTSLVEDIKAKPKSRVKELGLGADILGMRKRTEEPDKPKENVYNFFFEPKFQQNIRNYDENLKNLILNKDDAKQD